MGVKGNAPSVPLSFEYNYNNVELEINSGTFCAGNMFGRLISTTAMYVAEQTHYVVPFAGSNFRPPGRSISFKRKKEYNVRHCDGFPSLRLNWDALDCVGEFGSSPKAATLAALISRLAKCMQLCVFILYYISFDLMFVGLIGSCIRGRKNWTSG